MTYEWRVITEFGPDLPGDGHQYRLQFGCRLGKGWWHTEYEKKYRTRLKAQEALDARVYRLPHRSQDAS